MPSINSNAFLIPTRQCSRISTYDRRKRCLQPGLHALAYLEWWDSPSTSNCLGSHKINLEETRRQRKTKTDNTQQQTTNNNPRGKVESQTGQQKPHHSINSTSLTFYSTFSQILFWVNKHRLLFTEKQSMETQSIPIPNIYLPGPPRIKHCSVSQIWDCRHHHHDDFSNISKLFHPPPGCIWIYTASLLCSNHRPISKIKQH